MIGSARSSPVGGHKTLSRKSLRAPSSSRTHARPIATDAAKLFSAVASPAGTVGTSARRRASSSSRRLARSTAARSFSFAMRRVVSSRSSSSTFFRDRSTIRLASRRASSAASTLDVSGEAATFLERTISTYRRA
jgi:hypothetical protein